MTNNKLLEKLKEDIEVRGFSHHTCKFKKILNCTFFCAEKMPLNRIDYSGIFIWNAIKIS